MAISTFAELKAAILKWAEDQDIEEVVEDCIRLAEARLNREIKAREMGAVQTHDDLAFASVMALPTGFIEITSFNSPAPPPSLTIQYRPPHHFFGMQILNETGRPKIYTIVGTNLYIAPPPDSSDYEYTLQYLKEITPLDDTNTTNWLLDRAPDLYLFASLAEVEAFAQNTEAVAYWTLAYTNAKRSLLAQDVRSRTRPFAAMRSPSTGPFADGKHWN